MTSVAKKRSGKSKKSMSKKSPRRSLKKAKKAAAKKSLVKKAAAASSTTPRKGQKMDKKRVSFNESLNTAKTFDKNASLGKPEENSTPIEVENDEKSPILSRKDRKDYIQKLKAKKKPNYELSKKVKSLWEKLRNNKKLTLEEKNKITDELYSLVEGKAKQLIFAHDTVRVLQCLMALKSPHIRSKLFEELKDHILEMTKSKYSKFFVVKMLKYGTPDQRAHILKCLSGKIVDLIRHPIACDVVEYLYNDYAQVLQRSQICAEFYAAEYQVFQVNEVLSLKDIIARHPEKKNSIKEYMSQVILSVANKAAMRHSLLHKVCWDFLQNFGEDENLRKVRNFDGVSWLGSLKREIIDAIKDRIPEILHTKDGSHCSVYCIWHGDVKERKAIVKSLKNLVLKACTDEFGHQVLLAIFDTVDDTVVVNKTIIQEMKTNLEAIMKSHYGMRTILYLLNARDTKHFNKDQIAFLALGDNNVISKKPISVKHEQLLTEISPKLIEYAAENAREMIFSPSKFPLMFQYIACFAKGDRTPIYEQLIEILGEEFIPCNVENMHMVEHKNGHFALKQILSNDKKLKEANEATFVEYLIANLDTNVLSSWLCCNKGAFVLVSMIETEIDAVKNVVLDCVKQNLTKLKKYSFKGASVLIEKLKQSQS